MNVLYLSKHKRSAARALETLVERGCDVRAVVLPPPSGNEHPAQRTDLVAEHLGLPIVAEEQLYETLGDLRDVDLVLSFLFPRRILPPLISLPRLGCLNFHPAPLPDMRGVGGYNVAVLEGLSEWGVSAHFVDESFDTGDLIEVRRFAIDSEAETAWSLDLRSQKHLLDLFTAVIDTALSGRALPRVTQGQGRYVSRADLEGLRRIPADASAEEIDRRIRAFWYPPWPGATVERGGRPYTLIDQRVLDHVAGALRKAGQLP